MNRPIQIWLPLASIFRTWLTRFLPDRFPALVPLLAIAALFCLTGCSLPQVRAEDRLFLNLGLDFLGEYRLPKMEFADTPVGGLSGITYDRQRDRFYAISDDRSEFAPARFYTLKLTLDAPEAASPTAEPRSAIQPTVAVESVTVLKGEDGQPYAKGTVDLEGIALSPRQTLFISSEGVSKEGIAPFVDEFDLETGNWRGRLPMPARFIPGAIEGQPSGVQDNRGFEALTLNADGARQLEPFRLFTATESALQQDEPSATAETEPAKPTPIRFLHYLVGERPLLLSEHLYLLDPIPEGATDGGLSELLTLDQGGHFLSLERSFGIAAGFGVHLFQLATGGATDTSNIASFKGDVSGISPIYKRSLLDLSQLGIPLDNFEGMTLGPQLPDGSQSLLLVSDDNFNPLQATQFLLFRLRNGRA